MKLPLTTIGLVIVVIGLAVQVWRLEDRVSRLEYRGAVTTGSNCKPSGFDPNTVLCDN